MNQATPTVAVLITSYNAAPWLRECVDSVLAQTRPPDEIVVYDDGSTDDSLAILRSYGNRIRLISDAHDHSLKGIECQARGIHRAFLASSGDHVYLLDSDDRHLPDHIERYEALWREKPDLVMIQGSMGLIDIEGRRLRGLYHADREQRDYRRAIYRSHDTDFFYPTTALAFRRDFLAASLPLDFSDGTGAAIDARLSYAAVLAGDIGFVRGETAVFRYRPESLSTAIGIRDLTRVEETRLRLRQFNAIADRLGEPRIRLWRNLTYWQQLGRQTLPAWLAAPFLRWKMARYQKLTTPPA